MAVCTLFRVSLFALIFGAASPQRCRNKPIIRDMNEEACVSETWYLYAGNIECDNCCTIRRIESNQPGVVNVTDTIITNYITNVRTYTGYKVKHQPIYHVKGERNPYTLLDTDCKTYAVIYNAGYNSLQIFTTSVEQKDGFLDSLDVLKQCDMKIYEYNPKETCKSQLA